MTDPKNYRQFVRQLCKPGCDITAELTPSDAHLLHMAIGISGEAGEMLDAIKKAAIYRRPLDVANVREEAGDILFYLTGLLDALGIELQDVITENMEKLSLRYQSLSYSNASAIARMDKDHGSEIVTKDDPQPEIDPESDGFDEIVPRACSMDDPECESCQ